MKDKILACLKADRYVPSTTAEIRKRLRISEARLPEFQQTLDELEQGGWIARIKGHRYIVPSEADLIPGRIRMHRNGVGFLLPDDPALKEIRIAEHDTHTALHEDHVLVRRNLAATPVPDALTVRDSGTVIRILERRRTRFVGTLKRSRQFLVVVPDDPRIPHDFYVPEPKDVGRPGRVGDKVVVEFRAWESRHTNPEGEIVEVLGAPDAEGVDMLSVLRNYNLPLSFPAAVIDAARAIGREVRKADLTGRIDCRSHPVITIDPDDAKDFDDAIYVEKHQDGRWTLWVHIADVSHYVKPKSLLDVEARQRGNSTYLVDRVIPMLPEALSNELCSLKPDVDRLTKCVKFTLSREGKMLHADFLSCVIRSKRRFSYQEALAVLRASHPPTDPIDSMLHDAHTLAQRLRRARFKHGSLNLDFPETKIRLDEEGRILRIDRSENDESHQLIEEFMLLANEAVATELMRRKAHTVYRVHENPDDERLNEYRELVLSHHIPCGDLRQRAEVNKLLDHLDTLPVGPALKIGFLKSLMRARYAAQPLGHYGLAKQKYTHFTSPIRRFADLIVHRSLFEKQARSGAAATKEVADHISTTERNSADAERDSKDVKLYAHLEAQLASGRPDQLPASVTDLRNFGFFVDVPSLGMSGLVPLSSIDDDFFVLDAPRNRLVGRRTRRLIQLGDVITVVVGRVDRTLKRVDFKWVPVPGSTPSSRRNKGGTRSSATSTSSSRSHQGARQEERKGARPETGHSKNRPRPDAQYTEKSGPAKKRSWSAQPPVPPLMSTSSGSKSKAQSKGRPIIGTSHSKPAKDRPIITSKPAPPGSKPPKKSGPRRYGNK